MDPARGGRKIGEFKKRADHFGKHNVVFLKNGNLKFWNFEETKN
jgi:hypothetical protein